MSLIIILLVIANFILCIKIVKKSSLFKDLDFQAKYFSIIFWKNLLPFFRIVITYAAINCHFRSEIKENSKFFSSKISKVFFFIFNFNDYYLFNAAQSY